MAKKADKFSSVLVVSGAEGLLRRRFIAQVVAKKRAEGWAILDVDGTNPKAVRDAIEGDLFLPVSTLALVESPEKIDLDVLERHLAAKDYLTTLLLNIEGEPDGRTKFGKYVKGSLTDIHKNFPLPTTWKAGDVATAFLQEEAQRYGQQFPLPLATALTQRSGTDLGVLAYEVEKISILAKLDGVSVIEAKHVSRGMAPIAEASVLPITDALAMKQPKRLVKALAELKRTTKEDQTMRVSGLVASSAMKWMQAAYLDALPPKAAAEELGVNPWYFEQKILPAAQRWGKLGTVRLIADLAVAERAVLNGALDPWVVLTSRLLHACVGSSAR